MVSIEKLSIVFIEENLWAKLHFLSLGFDKVAELLIQKGADVNDPGQRSTEH